MPIRLIPEVVADALKHHKRRQAEARLAAGPTYMNQDLVFATSSGKPINPSNLIQRYFKPILATAGLPKDLRLYDLRHTFATLMIADGVSPKVVQERLGHADIALTLGTYTHVLPSMDRAATDKITRILFGDPCDGDKPEAQGE